MKKIDKYIWDKANEILFTADEDLVLDLGIEVSNDFGGGEIADLVLAAFKIGHTAGIKSGEAYLGKALEGILADNKEVDNA